MATINPDSSRKSVFIPYADGLQDPRLGLAENVLLYHQKDVFNGDFKYFTQRPSFNFVQKLQTSPGNYIGRPYCAAQFIDDFVAISTPTNIYIYYPAAGNTVTAVLTGADATNYNSSYNSAFNYKPVLCNYQYVSINTGRLLFLNDLPNQKLYALTSTGPAYTTVSLGFYPLTHGVSMDGYVFNAELNSDTIYNSNLDDITTWNLGVNFIRASQIPGYIRALARIKNFIVALKDNSIEFFYNAGLTDTSPLQRNTSYTQNVGLSLDNSLVQLENTLFFVGKSQGNTENNVWMMNDTNIKKISTASVDAFFNEQNALYPDFFKDGRFNAYCAEIHGKSYYVISYYGTATQASFCLAYDIKEDCWVKFTITANKNGFPATCGLYNLNRGGTYYYTSSEVTGGDGNACEGTFNIESAVTTKDSLLPSTYYTPILINTKVPDTDFGTGNRKFINEISFSTTAPDSMLHTGSFVKTRGGNRQTVTQTETVGDNLNLKNWGQFVSGYFTYNLYDPSSTATIGLDATRIKIGGINMDVTLGSS